MSSTIKCVSCKQRINLAPEASGIVTCPMCKTQQPVPDEQGKNAPQLPPQPIASSQANSSPVEPGTGFGPIDRSEPMERNNPIDRNPLNQTPPHTQHDFDPPKAGCGCLLAGALIAVTVSPLLLLAFVLA